MSLAEIETSPGNNENIRAQLESFDYFKVGLQISGREDRDIRDFEQVLSTMFMTNVLKS